MMQPVCDIGIYVPNELYKEAIKQHQPDYKTRNYNKSCDRKISNFCPVHLNPVSGGTRTTAAKKKQLTIRHIPPVSIRGQLETRNIYNFTVPGKNAGRQTDKISTTMMRKKNVATFTCNHFSDRLVRDDRMIPQHANYHRKSSGDIIFSNSKRTTNRLKRNLKIVQTRSDSDNRKIETFVRKEDRDCDRRVRSVKAVQTSDKDFSDEDVGSMEKTIWTTLLSLSAGGIPIGTTEEVGNTTKPIASQNGTGIFAFLYGSSVNEVKQPLLTNFHVCPGVIPLDDDDDNDRVQPAEHRYNLTTGLNEFEENRKIYSFAGKNKTTVDRTGKNTDLYCCKNYPLDSDHHQTSAYQNDEAKNKRREIGKNKRFIATNEDDDHQSDSQAIIASNLEENPIAVEMISKYQMESVNAIKDEYEEDWENYSDDDKRKDDDSIADIIKELSLIEEESNGETDNTTPYFTAEIRNVDEARQIIDEEICTDQH